MHVETDLPVWFTYGTYSRKVGNMKQVDRLGRIGGYSKIDDDGDLFPPFEGRIFTIVAICTEIEIL